MGPSADSLGRGHCGAEEALGAEIMHEVVGFLLGAGFGGVNTAHCALPRRVSGAHILSGGFCRIELS